MTQITALIATSTVLHFPIVRYAGSITDMHGIWHVVSAGERLTLATAYGIRLYRVRHTSVTLVDTPILHSAHADALYALAKRNIRPTTQMWNWLVTHELAEPDVGDDGKYRTTPLGYELAHALVSW